MPTVHRLSFYRNVLEHNPFRNTVRMAPRVCVGPIRYVGHDKLRRDIENLKTAMVAAGADEGFMPASAPITALQNDYYATEEEFITAYGDAMREEYQAILDAGLILQINFPMLVSRWDTASRTMRPRSVWPAAFSTRTKPFSASSVFRNRRRVRCIWQWR